MTERIHLAESFLQEAVYRSRGVQAVGSPGRVFGDQGDQGDQDDGAPGRCGLGERAAVALGLEGRGLELFHELWRQPPREEELGRIRAVTADWVRHQDAFDRRRNHFLKAFRGEHGSDRRAYDPELLREYEEGLAAINAEVDASRREAAGKLLAIASPRP